MKKCIICEDPAELEIKGTGDSYCKPCAQENFADESYLQKIETAETPVAKSFSEKESSIEEKKDVE